MGPLTAAFLSNEYPDCGANQVRKLAGSPDQLRELEREIPPRRSPYLSLHSREFSQILKALI